MESASELYRHLKRTLPKGTTNSDIRFIEDALLSVGRRYDFDAEYLADHQQTMTPGSRVRKLKRIESLANDTVTNFRALDPFLTRDLRAILGFDWPEVIIGHLENLKSAIGQVDLQTEGRPRDLAMREWVCAVADIFENSYQRRATISGSGTQRTRGRFYDLLEKCRPESMPRRKAVRGALSARQVRNILEDRHARQRRANQMVPTERG